MFRLIATHLTQPRWSLITYVIGSQSVCCQNVLLFNPRHHPKTETKTKKLKNCLKTVLRQDTVSRLNITGNRMLLEKISFDV